MKLEDCKAGMKVIYGKGTFYEDTGVIVEHNNSIFTNCGSAVWCRWSDGSVAYSSPGELTSNNAPSYTVDEILAILDKIEADCDDTSHDEWYATKRIFTKYGFDQLRSYLENIDENKKKAKLKAKAIAKLTAEELEALGVKVE
jgi:hypothetical protein